MKTIMNIFGEKPISKWMKVYAFIRFGKSRYNKLSKLNKRNNCDKQYKLRVYYDGVQYRLKEGKWISKKTVNDVLSYLNQHSSNVNTIGVTIYNDSENGDIFYEDFINTICRRFKRIKFINAYYRVPSGEWIPIGVYKY